MQQFLDIVDEVSTSLVFLNAERLEEILLVLEQQGGTVISDAGQAMSPAEREAIKERLGKLQAILAASEQNLLVLRNLHERAFNPLLQPFQNSIRRQGARNG